MATVAPPQRRDRRTFLWPLILGLALHPLLLVPWILMPGWAVQSIFAWPSTLLTILGLLPVLGWWFAARGAFALLAWLGIIGLLGWPALVLWSVVLLHEAWQATQPQWAVLGLQWLLYPA